MPNTEAPRGLSRRERQIMDILYREGSATAQEVREAIPDAPGYSAVRALLRILVEKGHATYTRTGPRYTYRPTVSKKKAERNAVRHLVETFFDDSVEHAVAALLGNAKLDDDELDRLTRLINEAKSK
ncbi:MAG: BlaI/MecI/CopY family transcriptional regulator [Rhodothermia bacterium]